MTAIQYDKDQSVLNRQGRKLQWLENWAAKVTLTFNVEEINSLSPGLSFSHNLASVVQHFSNGTTVTTPRSFNLGLGGTVSSDAQRIDKLDFFLAFKDFVNNLSYPNTDLRVPCHHDSKILIESDLKLKEWIEVATFANYTNSITTPGGYTFPMSVISHDVSFIVKASGNVTPTWKLVPVSINTNSPFLQAQRNSTNELLITLGPTAAAEAVPRKATPSEKAAPPTETEKPQPSLALVNSHLASEIGAAVAAALQRSLPP
jgi:hypothetical protein